LAIDGAEREAARSFLLERAEVLGYQVTRDPALQVVTGGYVIVPEIIGEFHRFHLPPAASGVRLVSRSAIPAYVHDDSDDHRRLGVAISRIKFDGHAIPLTDARLRSGWHEVESAGLDTAWRWTDGDAALALAGVDTLDIEVAITERYWIERKAAQERAA
jgi:hypothetical protein